MQRGAAEIGPRKLNCRSSKQQLPKVGKIPPFSEAEKDTSFGEHPAIDSRPRVSSVFNSDPSQISAVWSGGRVNASSRTNIDPSRYDHR